MSESDRLITEGRAAVHAILEDRSDEHYARAAKWFLIAVVTFIGASLIGAVVVHFWWPGVVL
jgi:hypothetical protein